MYRSSVAEAAGGEVQQSTVEKVRRGETAIYGIPAASADSANPFAAGSRKPRMMRSLMGSVTLSKNGTQVNAKLSQKFGLLSCIRQESGAKSHAKVIIYQNWTRLSHDFCTAFMTDI